MGQHWILTGAIKFNSDWNLLMTVVEKIELMGYDSRIMGNNSDGGFLCDFTNLENEEFACEVSYNSKIEAVYNAVVGFIKLKKS